MEGKPRLAKAHSKSVADEYLRLGWTLKHEFFAPEHDDEPYEYLFEWNNEAEPVSVDWVEFHQKHAK